MEEQGNKQKRKRNQPTEPETDSMDKKQKECILNNQEFFVSNMLDEPTVLDCLLSLGILSTNLVEKIKSKKTRANRVRELNIMMTKRPADAFNAYHRALIISGNKHLAKKLEPYLSPNLQKGQGAKKKKKRNVAYGDEQMAEQAMAETSGEPSAGVSLSIQQNQHIMISYHTANQHNLEDLRDALRGCGYIVWMAAYDLTRNVNQAMTNAVENSFAVLVAGSEKYMDSFTCMQEAEYANGIEKPIILLLMETNFKASGRLAFITNSGTPIPFTKAVAFDESFNKLVKELEAIRQD